MIGTLKRKKEFKASRQKETDEIKNYVTYFGVSNI